MLSDHKSSLRLIVSSNNKIGHLRHSVLNLICGKGGEMSVLYHPADGSIGRLCCVALAIFANPSYFHVIVHSEIQVLGNNMTFYILISWLEFYQ